MNVAYQPTAMLTAADLGVPMPHASDAMLAGEEPLQYMVRTEVPLSDYTILGSSTNETLKHAELDESGSIAILPTHAFYLIRGPDALPGAPSSAVLARRYTRGLVLYRTDTFGHSETFMASSSVVLPLNGTYRRVSRVAGNTTLGEPITEVRLQGYEGAVLVKEPDPPPPGKNANMHNQNTQTPKRMNDGNRASADGVGFLAVWSVWSVAAAIAVLAFPRS
jgi:hypothetical protein